MDIASLGKLNLLKLNGSIAIDTRNKYIEYYNDLISSDDILR